MGTRDFKEIAADMEKMYSMSCKPSFARVKEGHVFDEDKSVKWNREQVELNNEKYDSEVKKLNTEKNRVRDTLLDEMYEAIVEYVGKKHINKDKAKKFGIMLMKKVIQVVCQKY